MMMMIWLGSMQHMKVFLSEGNSQLCIAIGCAMKLTVVTVNSCCNSCYYNAEMPDYHQSVSVVPLQITVFSVNYIWQCTADFYCKIII
jgi:hypothetical protein